MPKSLALLLRDAHAAVDLQVQEALTARGFTEITPGHMLVLRNLGEDGARPSELATSAGVTRQAITKVVDDLERVGLVTREPVPGDGRGVVVHYTPRGLEGLAVARARMHELEDELSRRAGRRQWAAARQVLEALF